MPARSVTRPSIPGRIRNPYYAQAQTATGGNAAAAQQANAQRLAQLREQQLAAANNGQSGLELGQNHFQVAAQLQSRLNKHYRVGRTRQSGPTWSQQPITVEMVAS